MKWLFYIPILLLLAGCSQYKDYADTYKMLVIEKRAERNANMRLLLKLRHEHQLELEKVRNERLELYSKAQNAAAKTKDPNDDVLVNMMFLTMVALDSAKSSESFNMNQFLATYGDPRLNQDPALVAPETPGQFIQRAGGTILGVGGIVAAVYDSNNDRKVMEALAARQSMQFNLNGTGSRMAYDSFKTGSQNTISGEGNSVTGGSLTGPMQSTMDEMSEDITDPEHGCTSTPPEICGSNPVCVDGEWRYSLNCSCPSHLNGDC